MVTKCHCLSFFGKVKTAAGRFFSYPLKSTTDRVFQDERIPSSDWRTRAALIACAVLVSACSTVRSDISQAAMTASGMGQVKNVLGNDLNGRAQLDIDAELIGDSPFLLYPLARESKERLPAKPVHNLHLSEVSLYDALKLLLDGTGIALSFEGGQMQGARYQTAVVSNLEGNLPEVVEKMSKALGFFYRIEGGVLYIVQEEQFVLELPPVLSDDSLASLTNSLQYLGARDVYLDRDNRSLTLRANRARIDYIRQYVDRIRETRSMLIYDLYVYQVDLTDTNQTGIQWNKFKQSSRANGNPFEAGLSGGQSTASNDNAAAGGFGLGLVYNTAHFSLDVLLTFLKTQGAVRTVSQPRIALMSGSKGKLRIGQSTRYVSKIGTNTGTSLSQTTVETSDLQTGLDMSIYGDLHDGTVYTKLSLSLTSLIQFNRFTALGTDLTLPQTADRAYRSDVRALPGDTILLGGMIQERDGNNVSGLPVTDKSVVLGNKSIDIAKSELVLVLKTSVVKFSKKPAATGRPDAPLALPAEATSMPGAPAAVQVATASEAT